MNKNRKRISYWEKLIKDEDIPLEELNLLMIKRNHNKIMMDMYVGSNNHATSEFRSEAYLEYRRRVFEQLAAEHDKEKQSEVAMDSNTSITTPLPQPEDVDSKAAGETLKNWYDSQPTWDDSDLQAETYTISPSLNITSLPLQWKMNQVNDCNSIMQPQVVGGNDINNTEIPSNNPLMSWSSFDEQISFLSCKTMSEQSLQPGYENNDNSYAISRDFNDEKKNAQQLEEQKLEREAIRRKLALGGDSDDLEEDDGVGYGKSLSKLDHTFSANSQSLHICYINDSCSSDESVDESQPSSTSLPAFSPTSSPAYSSSLMLEKRRTKSNISDATSSSSSSASSSAGSETRITGNHNVEDNSRLNRARCKELELEARFQLAQAQQKAKLLAEEEKRRQKREHRSSLAQRLLSETLPEDTAAKLKSYSLTKRDCRSMTVGQLQLILNDMHTRKQALNEDLMRQLVARDDLQTEQDAKLIDVEDSNSMLNAMGPETTV